MDKHTCREYVDRIIANNEKLYADWLKRRELAFGVTDPEELSRLGFVRRQYED